MFLLNLRANNKCIFKLMLGQILIIDGKDEFLINLLNLGGVVHLDSLIGGFSLDKVDLC